MAYCRPCNPSCCSTGERSLAMPDLHPRCSPRRRNQRGSTIMEFALIGTLFLLPCFLGTIAFGVNLGRSIQVTTFTRDMGHIYSQGVDLSGIQAQITAGTSTIPQNLAGNVSLSTSGTGVIILSKIITVYAADCTAAGVSPCTNQNQQVFTNRIVIGNSSLRSSNFGSPSGMDSSGNISAATYLGSTSARATNFGTVLSTAGITQSQGDVAYVAEGYFQTADVSGFGYGTAGVYSRAIF